MYKFHIFNNIEQNEQIVLLTIPKKELTLNGKYQIEILKMDTEKFVHCYQLDFENENIIFNYKLKKGFYSYSDRSTYTHVEKILYLLKIGEIFEDKNRSYGVFFDPRNIYISNFYEVYFLFKILPDTLYESKKPEKDELEEYKAFILSALQSKYSFIQLMEIGIDVLEKNSLYKEIILANSYIEIKETLLEEYNKNYKESVIERVAFSTKTIKILVLLFTIIIVSLCISVSYFAYRSITETSAFQKRMNIYESHYNRDPIKVYEFSEKLSNEQMSNTLRIVVADSLIAIGEAEMLERAFYLDPSRQIEVIEKLIELENIDIITSLRSDKIKVQIYQYYYSGDYEKVKTMVENDIELQNDARAKILLAKSYMNLGDYVKAELIAEELKDKDLQLNIYKEHRDQVIKYETDIELRSKILEILNQIISVLEEQK